MADIVPVGNGLFRWVDATRSRVAYAAGPPDARWVFLDGRVYVVDVTQQSSSPRKKRVDEHIALAAPMPATVVSINAPAGARVKTGDVLIVLEAMKMELPIKAPRDGIVTTVACRAGELVQPGVPLLELE